MIDDPPARRDVPRDEPPQPSRTGKPRELPHDLPFYPEDAPLDEKGEPIVRP